MLIIYYISYTIYNFLLTFYLIFLNKYNYIKKIINKKIKKPKNLVYIFDNTNFIGKENYDSYIKMTEILKLVEDNNNYFIFHKYSYLDVNYISNNFYINTENLIQTNFTFILVEIESKNNKIDLTNFLNNKNNNHYIVNNKLFDYNHIIWLKFNNFDIDIYNYKINIIDNNINNYSIDNKKFVLLFNNTYKIEENICN